MAEYSAPKQTVLTLFTPENQQAELVASAEPVTVPRKRRRPALSCEQCRRRKIKCDRGDPCRQCLQSKAKTCTYTQQPPPKTHSKSTETFQYTTTPLSGPPIPGRPKPQSSAATSSTHSPTSNVFDSATAASSWSSPAADRNTEFPPNVHALLDRVQKLEQLLSESTSNVERIRNPTFESSTPRPKKLRGTLSKTRFFGESHWMHTFGRFDTIACVRENEVLNTPTFASEEMGASEITSLLEQCKAMARSAKMEAHTEWLVNPDIKNMVPSREICDVLVGLYFSTCESQYRILHFPSFHREYVQYWEQPSAASISFTLKMLLAMANGVIFYQRPNVEDLRAQAKKWIFAANNWLNTTPTEKSRLNISGLQIHCLLILARQANAVVGDLVWVSAGSLLRAAFTMGFHRDPTYFPRMSALHAELRRRLWATIVELNVQLALDSGMNPLISMDDFDTEPPANINDIDVDETTRERPVSRPSNFFTQNTAQLILLKSLPLRLRICRFINDIRSEPSYDEVLELSTQISKACKDSATLVQGAQTEDQSVKITQLQRNLLDQSTRRFLQTLHRGYSLKAQTDPRYYFSRKVALDCAILMASYPSKEDGTAAPLSDQPRDEFTQYKICGGGFLKSVMIQSAMTVFNELLQQVEEDTPGTEQGALARAPLKKILRDTIDLLGERIGIAENNVKGHLFMSAILGQIEYLEEGRSPELGALEAAKKSANLCFRLLAKRAPSTYGGDFQPPESSDWRSGEAQVVQNNGIVEDFGMQDWNMDFEIPDSWLFAGWEENRCW